MICIVDYDVCNVGSIVNMFRRIGVPARLVSTAQDIAAAQALVLPGVGSFDAGMSCLEQRGLTDVLKQRVLEDKVPVLGICLGAQLMTAGSEEGQLPGLGFFHATVRKFRFEDASRKIPHIGWNWALPGKSSSMLAGFDTPPRFYFVHSYFIECADPEDVLLRTAYGRPFTSAMERDNIIGVQFHPEKSHRFGMQLLANFSRRVALKAA